WWVGTWDGCGLGGLDSWRHLFGSKGEPASDYDRGVHLVASVDINPGRNGQRYLGSIVPLADLRGARATGHGNCFGQAGRGVGKAEGMGILSCCRSDGLLVDPWRVFCRRGGHFISRAWVSAPPGVDTAGV